MREIALDFEPRRPGILMVVLLLTSALLCLDAWLEYSIQRDGLDAANSRLAQAQTRASRLDRNQREKQPEKLFSPEESRALNAATQAIRVDWESLFRRIDEAAGEDVSLLAVRPNAGGKSLRLSGEARNLAATLAFVEALRASPLADSVLISHQIKASDADKPIIFEISATWLSGS